MTNEEFERAIDFLLKSQVGFEARQARFEAQMEQAKERQDRTDEQISQTSLQLSQLSDGLNALADTQTEFMRVMAGYIESEAQRQARAEETQARINESLRAGISELASKQVQTEVSLTKLAQTVDTLADAQAGTNNRLDALIKVVEEDRRGRKQ